MKHDSFDYWQQVKTDKLQHEMYWNLFESFEIKLAVQINYNMRCIETQLDIRTDGKLSEINYNMRCIETYNNI